jgi:hypothetical protein
VRPFVDDSSSLGYYGVLTGYYGVLTGYHGYYGAHKYPASGLKEALAAAHSWMRTASLHGVESCYEGLQRVVWVLHRPLGESWGTDDVNHFEHACSTALG